MQIADAIQMVRRDISDAPENFLVNNLVDGMTLLYDLPQQYVNPIGLNVQYVVSGTVTVMNPTSAYPAWNAGTTYSPGQLVSFGGYYYHALQAGIGQQPSSINTNTTFWAADIAYLLDSNAGALTTNTAIPNNYLLIVSGQAWRLFTDADLTTIIYDAARKHGQGQTIGERYRTNQGFITYRDTPKTLDNLPKQEESLVVTLADIMCFYTLASDAASDVDVVTAEGTMINHSQRFSQLMQIIDKLENWYELQCSQWNVGYLRMETMQLRRVSRTTGRLVPIFREREYDDHRYPERELPQIDRRDTDVSGVPSVIWNGSPM